MTNIKKILSFLLTIGYCQAMEGQSSDYPTLLPPISRILASIPAEMRDLKRARTSIEEEEYGRPTKYSLIQRESEKEIASIPSISCSLFPTAAKETYSDSSQNIKVPQFTTCEEGVIFYLNENLKVGEWIHTYLELAKKFNLKIKKVMHIASKNNLTQEKILNLPKKKAPHRLSSEQKEKTIALLKVIDPQTRTYQYTYPEIEKLTGATSKNIRTLIKKYSLREKLTKSKLPRGEKTGTSSETSSLKSYNAIDEEAGSEYHPPAPTKFPFAPFVATLKDQANIDNDFCQFNLGNFPVINNQGHGQEKPIEITLSQLQTFIYGKEQDKKGQFYLGFLGIDYETYEALSDFTLLEEFERRINLFKKAFINPSLLDVESTVSLYLGQHEILNKVYSISLSTRQISYLENKNKSEKLNLLAAGILKLNYILYMETPKAKQTLNKIVKTLDRIKTLFMMKSINSQLQSIPATGSGEEST